MNPLNERQTRGYFLFLAVFSTALVFLAFLGSWVQARLLGEAIAQREAAIASSLTEQGVPLTALATAFKNTEVTKSGLSFLAKIGHSKDTPIWLTASTDKSSAWFLAFGVCAMLLVAILLAVSFFFLSRRERLYTQAAGILSKFAAGDFSVRLPRNQPGALYRMFARADQLAMALYSQNEAEHKSQEFLKQTISDISHQLKTPLSALSMYLEILQNETENPDTVRKFSEKALRSLSRIENFIQTLLKIARLDADSISFEIKPCSISSLAVQATEEFRTRAAAENKKLLMEGPSDAICCVILCGLKKLSQTWLKMLWNTLLQAVRYESPGKIPLSQPESSCQMTAAEFPLRISITYLSVSTAVRLLTTARASVWVCHWPRQSWKARTEFSPSRAILGKEPPSQCPSLQNRKPKFTGM